jgi:dipeptidyl aminopeptidase/acylaminoacyl peptidase
VSSRGGQIGIVRVRADGSLQTMWDRSNAFLRGIFPRGDSIIAAVEQPDGTQRQMILSSSGRGGRIILEVGDVVTQVSPDGTRALYTKTVDGATEQHILDLVTGSTRRLTTSPESENGAEFSPDGKSVLFRRARITQRVYSVDVSGLLKGPTP